MVTPLNDPDVFRTRVSPNFRPVEPNSLRTRASPQFQPVEPNSLRTRASPLFQHAGPGARGPGASAFGPNSIPPDGSRPIPMGRQTSFSDGTSAGGQRTGFRSPSPEAQAFQQSGAGRATDLGQQTASPQSPHRTGRLTPSGPAKPVGRLGKATGAAGVGAGIYGAVRSLRDGRYGDAALSAGDALAGVGLMVPHPIARGLSTAWLAGRAVHGVADQALSEEARDTIGGTVNQMVGGVDDSALLGQRAQERLARPPQIDPAAETAAMENWATAPTATAPTVRDRDLGNGIRRIDTLGQSPMFTNRADPNAPMALEPRSEEQAAANLRRNLASIERTRADNRELAMMRAGLQDQGDVDFYRPENVEARRREARDLDMRLERDALRGEAERLGTRMRREAQWVAGEREPDAFNRLDRRRNGLRQGPLPSEAAMAALQSRREGLRDQMNFEATQDRTRAESDDRARRDAVTLRGQDIDADIAQSKAQQEQFNKDRQYQLDVAKYGVDRADSLLKQRQDSAKNMGSRIASMLPPGRDGKPDTATAARYTEALNAQVGELMQQLREELAQDPTNRQKAADLQALEEKGLGALDEEDVRRFVAGMQYNELRAREQSSIPLVGGLMPWSSRHVESAAPVTGLRRETRFGFDRYVDDQGGSVPAYKVDRRGSTLGLFGTSNRNFDILKR